MYWDVRDFKRRSDSIAARTFRRALTGSRFLDRISKVISSLAKDCQYDTAAIKSAFQTTTGSEVKMFNPLCTDTKVAVTTTTARESFACLFSNYNGSFMPEDSSKTLFDRSGKFMWLKL